MAIKFLTAGQAVNKAYYKMPVSHTELECFNKAFVKLLNGRKEGESEEYHKNLVRGFLMEVWYADYEVNTLGRADLVIHHKKDDKASGESAPVGVTIEAKSPQNKAEMFSESNTRAKALCCVVWG